MSSLNFFTALLLILISFLGWICKFNKYLKLRLMFKSTLILTTNCRLNRFSICIFNPHLNFCHSLNFVYHPKLIYSSYANIQPSISNPKKYLLLTLNPFKKISSPHSYIFFIRKPNMSILIYPHFWNEKIFHHILIYSHLKKPSYNLTLNSSQIQIICPHSNRK